MSLFHKFMGGEHERRVALATAAVVPEAIRCIQCGVCSYNCPVGTDVRAYAWRGLPVTDAECIRCGECVTHCPRRTLRLLPPAEHYAGRPVEDVLPLHGGEA